MTTVPLPSYATLFSHFLHACQPFWCHRHTVVVPSGVVYDVEDFRVRLGDVRQTQPAGRVRGTVVEIEWKGPSLVTWIQQAATTMKCRGGAGHVESAPFLSFFSSLHVDDADVDADFAATAALIREFWARLGIEGAREAILVPDLGKEVKAQLRILKLQEKQQQQQQQPTKQLPVWHAYDVFDLAGKQDDPDPDAGVDLARQFMEIFRFNR